MAVKINLVLDFEKGNPIFLPKNCVTFQFLYVTF